jgi:NTP pyrophosphatase (non-canonical NTP hydrolase)
MTKANKLANFSMGLAGESGELIDLLKKHLYQGHEIDINKVSEEISDTIWYLGNIANIFNINLSDAMDANIAKLKARYPSGFDKNRSVNR